MTQQTTIVVPCYNEAARFSPEPFLAFLAEDQEACLFFVNDGSTDDTDALLRRLAEREPRIEVRSLGRNCGKAEAVRIGLHACFARGDALVGFWDADLATPLSYVKEFKDVLRDPRVILVFGSRVQLLGHEIARRGHRHYLGRVIATWASLTLGLPVYDTQCGAKLFRNSEHTRRAFSEPFASRWLFDVEVFSRLLREERPPDFVVRRDCVERPIRSWTDVPGSTLGLRSAPRILVEMIRVTRARLRDSSIRVAP